MKGLNVRFGCTVMSYESNILRDWYLLFHFGTADEVLDDVAFDPSGLPPGCLEFPVATVKAAGIAEPIGRALDIGCAVGRSSFELTKLASEVIGIDFSQSFIDVAEEIRHGKEIVYRRYNEMHQPEPLRVNLPDGVKLDHVSFEQGDAMNLREDLGKFNLVHAANLLCRLTEPQKFLNRLPDLVAEGGTLVIATPATWMEEYTTRENLPQGATLDYLKKHLSENFEFQRVCEVPFLIREHKRKLQLSTSQTSTWKRHG
ncbi:MAG: putative 4-mercaptohistidine N1-methyltransferase [Verrucomicrobiales bacterium]|mgnify:CR=1 FL=1|nr:putative 4-mercaptohistidine N1-methyltransferase [Verrucomicrobiales bacterium]